MDSEEKKMFDNVGFKIKIVAIALTILVVACLAIGAVASGVLLISGHGGDLSLKVFLISIGGGALIYFTATFWVWAYDRTK